MNKDLSKNLSKKEEKRRYWEDHVNQWQSSGESQSNYCRQHQLHLHQFTYWKQALDGKSSKAVATSAGFVKVEVIPAPQLSTQRLSIRLPNGIHIEGANADNLPMIQEIMGWNV